ncbi:hypothetical protein [Streptomyces sp. NBC_00096]|uniref:hypothetical protein n=1 Tax=Streptomyces sp. NBC_00096 TaxID=2975650 RepID=UPI003243BB55
MTAAEPEKFSRDTLVRYLSIIDELVAQPFPETDADDDTGHAGPTHRERGLRRSRDFWDDVHHEAWHEADEDMRAHLDAAVVVDDGGFVTAQESVEGGTEPAEVAGAVAGGGARVAGGLAGHRRTRHDAAVRVEDDLLDRDARVEGGGQAADLEGELVRPGRLGGERPVQTVDIDVDVVGPVADKDLGSSLKTYPSVPAVRAIPDARPAARVSPVTG